MRYTGYAKMNFLSQVFRKLSYYSLRMRAFSNVWSLPVGSSDKAIAVTPVDTP